MGDSFGGHAVGRSDPCPNALDITPSDSATIDPPLRCIYPHADGTVKITLATGTDHTLAVFGGVVPPFAGITKVWATPTPPTITGGW